MNEKVKEHLMNKNLIYTYDEHNQLYTIPVPAKQWNETQLAFECPFCYNKYKLNGKPYKNGHHVYHFHGKCEKDADGNYGVRTPHCGHETRRYWDLPTFEFKLIGGNMIY